MPREEKSSENAFLCLSWAYYAEYSFFSKALIRFHVKRLGAEKIQLCKARHGRYG